VFTSNAEARAEARQEAETRLEQDRVQNRADTETILRKKGLSDIMIAEIQSEPDSSAKQSIEITCKSSILSKASTQCWLYIPSWNINFQFFYKNVFFLVKIMLVFKLKCDEFIEVLCGTRMDSKVFNNQRRNYVLSKMWKTNKKKCQVL